MEYKNLILEKNENIATILINRPEHLNALNLEILFELKDVVEKLEVDGSIKIVKITGTGEKSFIAGADIEYMSKLSMIEAKSFSKLGSNIFRFIEKSKKVYIALINGYALGGGCELLLACDIRIASENAKFGQPEVSLGIIPGFSGTQRLSRAIGMTKAKELIFTGKTIDAKEALLINLVSHVVAFENLNEKFNEISEKILKNSFEAVQLAKEVMNTGYELDMDRAMEFEENLFGMCFSLKDQKKKMEAFLNKKLPK